MELNDIQEIIKKHANEIEKNVIPTVTIKVMDSFYEGFNCGMDIGSAVIRDETIGFLYLLLNRGEIEVRDMDKLVTEYKDFIDAAQMKRKETKP